MENQDPEHQFTTGRSVGDRKKVPAKNLSLRNKFPLSKQDGLSCVRKLDDSNNSKTNQNTYSIRDLASTSTHRNSNDVISTENNDSLCDFKSPIKDEENNESLADFILKPTILKSNKRSTRQESKSIVKKKRCNRNIASSSNQSSIASSFFKPRQTSAQTALSCPLCFKSYKDAIGQRNHMKNCAAKNKIPTDKLLDAVELQEKQANERKAMGLLPGPLIQPKKNISKKLISDKDPQLQLALALSMSLHEAQVTEEYEDAHLLAGEPCLPINAEMTDERRKTLQNFGFTTNKPVTASTSGRSRKKRPLGPTALQTRTQEERDRLLTVRIAEVLMGDEAITQALLENVETVIKSGENIVIQSRLLQSYHCVDDRLWEKTQQCSNGQSLYSCDLVGLSPCKVKPEPEIKEPELETSKLKTPMQITNNTLDIVDKDIVSDSVKLQNSPKSLAFENDKAIVEKHNTDEKSTMNLAKDWRSMLGVSYLSDVLVIVKDNVEIYAHEIVFWARCYNIVDDINDDKTESSQKRQRRILWLEIDHLSARAFLEYIYCGVIDRYASIFELPHMLTEVRSLARKYRLKKLFAYLRDKLNELKGKVKTNLELNKFDGSSSSLGKDENSISSVETDINSVSTVCNDLVTNKSVNDEQSSDSDNVGRNNVASINVVEREDISNDSTVHCISSSNDSFIKQISSNSLSMKDTNEESCDREKSEKISRSFALGDITGIESFARSTLLPSKKDQDATHKNDINVKLIDEPVEDDRCTSPDIFDDSATASAANTCRVPKEFEHEFEHDMNGSDADIEILCTSSNSFRVEIPEKSKKPKVDCSFVSTRRRPFRGNVRNLDSVNTLDQRKKMSTSPLKQKGEITMAIEQIQRLNAKTASESDSEHESVEYSPIKKRTNPFRLKATDTSSNNDKIVKNDSYSELTHRTPPKRRNKLSIFEKRIELEAATNPAMFNITSSKPVTDVYFQRKKSTDNLKSSASSVEPQDCELTRKENKVERTDRMKLTQKDSSKPDDTVEAFFDLTQESSRESNLDSEEENCNETTKEEDLSMYTKYKRKQSHNSIHKYRAAIKNITSQNFVSSTKETDKTQSSNDLSNSHDELWNARHIMKRNSSPSKYEYASQSTSNYHRKSSNMVSKSNQQYDSSPQILSSTESDELSDLEIDLADFSKSKSLNQMSLTSVDSKSQDVSMSNRLSGNRIFDDKREINSTNSKLKDYDSTMMNNDIELETKKTNLSDQETDVECYIESISQLKEPKTMGKIQRQSHADEDKSFDIYNAETDSGEKEDKYYKPGYHKTVSKEVPQSLSVDTDHCEISSPDCEISEIFSPSSVDFDHGVKSTEISKERNTTNKEADENYYTLQSDSSDNDIYKMHKRKSSPSSSLVNRSKAMKERSFDSRRRSITPEQSSKSSLRSFGMKSVSENVIQTNFKSGANFMDDSFEIELARVQTPPIQERSTSCNNDERTPQQNRLSENVTPLANYSAMKTPELRKELQKYGLKPQKRHRAKQLLRYIYNELHPVVPVSNVPKIASYSNESSSEDERPPPKRLNKSNSFEAVNSRQNADNINSDSESLALDIRSLSDSSNENEDLENNDFYTSSQSDNSEGLKNAIRKLVDVDRSLHNKILSYEPLILEELHSTLKAQGIKSKLNALMDFLDEQCITFRTLANAKKNRTRRRASPKGIPNTQ